MLIFTAVSSLILSWIIKSHKGFVTVMNFTWALGVQFKCYTGLSHHIYFLCYPLMVCTLCEGGMAGVGRRTGSYLETLRGTDSLPSHLFGAAL